MDQLVEQLHVCLARAIRQGRSGSFDAPVTVAEIYQDLVPYRSVRSTLGLDMNADYEHTLLRMLAGEGHFARLEPMEARDELRRELDSPNPNVGLFRKFAACDVWITPRVADAESDPEEEPLPLLADEPDAAGDPSAFAHAHAEPIRNEVAAGPAEPAGSVAADVEEEEEMSEVVDWEAPGGEPELLLEEAVEEAEAIDGPVYEVSTETAEEPAVSSTSHVLEAPATGHCAFCDSALPATRAVRFCPFCGADQSTRPCPACSEPLEVSWAYCVACGTHAPAAP